MVEEVNTEWAFSYNQLHVETIIIYALNGSSHVISVNSFVKYDN